MNAFPKKSKTRLKCSFSLLLFNTVLEIPTNTMRQEKAYKAAKLKMKKCHFLDSLTYVVYVEKVGGTKNVVALMREFRKIPRFKAM